MTMKISTQLKRWRARRGLSQSQAAPVLGVTLKTLQNWEQQANQPRGLARSALLKMLNANS
jgi:DNA-binding transcriptional regulator YiaG